MLGSPFGVMVMLGSRCRPAVMLGSLLWGTTEAPGVLFSDGAVLKKFRGGAALEVTETGGALSSHCYSDVAEGQMAQGVPAALQDKGSVQKFLPYLSAGIQRGCQHVGARSLSALR
eukprot:XP_024997828.1 inosine-5'-monophosphate dehydrogenase 1-like [Gallus gallus]